MNKPKMPNTNPLRELLEQIETADAEAKHRAFLEWAKAARAAQPALLARLAERDALLSALEKITRTGPAYGLDPKSKVGAARVGWNVHWIAQAAIDEAREGERREG